MAPKAKVSKEPENTVAVTALTPIRYDGDDYAEGEQIDMRESCVDQLVVIGAVSLKPAAAPAA